MNNKTRKNIQIRRDLRYKEILDSFKSDVSNEIDKDFKELEEINSKSDDASNNLDTDKDIEESNKELSNISDEKIDNFKIPEVPEDYLNKLPEDKHELYLVGKKLSEDYDSEVDILKYKKYLVNTNIPDLSSDNIEVRNKAIKSAKDILIFMAYNIYIEYENMSFMANITDISDKTYAESIADKVFNSNAEMYGYDINTKSYIPYASSDDNKDEEKMLSSSKDEVREAYAESINNTKLLKFINESVDDTFIKSMIKKCNNFIRYKRCINDVNLFIRYYLESINNIDSFISSCEHMESFVNRIYVNSNKRYKELNDTHDGILSKSIIFILYKRSFSESVSNFPYAFWVYMFNLNLSMLNCNGTKNMNPYIKLYFDSVHAIIDTVYHKLLDYFDKNK